MATPSSGDHNFRMIRQVRKALKQTQHVLHQASYEENSRTLPMYNPEERGKRGYILAVL